MRAKLPDACQSCGNRITRIATVRQACANQRLKDEHILLGAQRIQHHAALEDFPSARVYDACAIGPAPGRTVDPVYDVIAHIQRVDTRRQFFDTKGINISSMFKSLRPPRNAIEQGFTDCWRCSGIDIVHNWFFNARASCIWVDFLKSMPKCNLAQHGATKWYGEVILRHIDDVIIGVMAHLHWNDRQSHQRMAHPQRNIRARR